MVPAFGKQRKEDCSKLESSLHRLNLKNKTITKGWRYRYVVEHYAQALGFNPQQRG